MSRTIPFTVAAAVAACFALAPVAAGAEEKAGAAETTPAGDKVDAGASAEGGGNAARASGGKRKVLRLEALTVEGKLQKPEAFYILQRANPEFDELGRPESFLPKVIRSERDDIF